MGLQTSILGLYLLFNMVPENNGQLLNRKFEKIVYICDLRSRDLKGKKKMTECNFETLAFLFRFKYGGRFR